MMAMLMNDADLAQTVTKCFLEDMPHQIAALTGYLKAGDVTGVERQVHSIKGASANVCSEVLRKLAIEMEKAAMSGDLVAVASRMAELEAKFDALKKAMTEEG